MTSHHNSANKGMYHHELQAHSTATSNHVAGNALDTCTPDEKQLLRLGKKPALKRNFGFMAVLGYSCTVLITWEGAIVTSSSALLNGGPAGVLWGFLVCWIGTTSYNLVLAELSSMAPTSGGQYHWVSLLAPPSARKFLSYITGWTTVAGWQAGNVSNAFLVASSIQGTVVLTNASYVPLPWQAVLMTWAILALAIILNTGSNRILARFEGVILVLHLFGFFAILIPLVYFGPHGDVSLWTTTYNGGGWSTPSLSFLVGLPSFVFSLFGSDGAVHMSEEIFNASTAVPQALVLTMCINGTLGFAMLVALVFCMGDLQAALDARETYGYAYLEIFAQAVQSRGGAAAMASVIHVLSIFCTVGSVAASTRLLWAFARDRAVPFASQLSKLNRNSKLPFNTLITTMVISVLLSLIVLGSSVAFNDVLSLTVACLSASYLLCSFMLLYRRLQGKIGQQDDAFPITGPENLRWGPWRVPEPYGTINNVFACLYLTWMLFWSFWPPYAVVTPTTMNFSVVVFGAVALFSILWYFVRARKYYDGPVRELD